MIRILISTGEVSGDLQGSLLVHALKVEASERDLSLQVFALGGVRMKSSGAQIIADTSLIGAIGFWEAIPFVLPTLKIQKLVDKFIANKQPDVVVLLDYMGPNIRLGNKISKLKKKIPIVYYIAPQEWAWSFGNGGSTDLINFSDKILAIFEAEAEYYSDKGGEVQWVGHPMLDTVKDLPNTNEAYDRLNIDQNKRVVLLLPASRKQEIKYLMPVLAEAASILQERDPSLYFIVPASLQVFETTIAETLANYSVVGEVIPANKTDELKPYLFSAAELAIGKSGTINMELALNLVPQIVGYKISRVTAFILRKFLKFKIDHISPVNLLMKERLIPELVQHDFNAQSIVDFAVPLLEQSIVRSRMLDGYARFKERLGSPGVTARAAKEIIDLAEKNTKKS